MLLAAVLSVTLYWPGINIPLQPGENLVIHATCPNGCTIKYRCQNEVVYTLPIHTHNLDTEGFFWHCGITPEYRDCDATILVEGGFGTQASVYVVETVGAEIKFKRRLLPWMQYRQFRRRL